MNGLFVTKYANINLLYIGFNRNHDLKRHKRIHLAVKPFPCNHCDKSFSRKDALKVSPDTYNAMDRVILTRITETYLGERLRQWPFRWRWNRPRGRHQVGFSQRWGEWEPSSRHSGIISVFCSRLDLVPAMELSMNLLLYNILFLFKYWALYIGYDLMAGGL